VLPNVLHSWTFKVLGIGFLALVMLIPLSQVQGLIGERNGLREKAVASIANGWGDQQWLGGPVIAVPKRVRVATNMGWVTQESTEIILPDRLAITATLVPEIRKYGIYDAPVYTSEIKLSGSFLARDITGLAEAETTYQWERAELRVPVGDVRGLRRISSLRVADEDYAFGPSDGGVGNLGAIAVAMDPTKYKNDRIAFEFDLTLAGTQVLDFLPLARVTDVSMRSPWPNPSFDGAFLPDKRNIAASGFEAHWQVLDLNRPFGQRWQQDARSSTLVTTAAFGVSLYEPASLYQQNERAGKYGVLFVALTFVAFFLFEVLKKLRVHPVQYLLVGVALITFYVVLLALSEQIGFAWAYGAASLAVVMMIGSYAAAILRAWRAGALLAGMLALVYALLYGLVVSEQYSLLMGATALLAVVAALMHLTRKVDWYAATNAGAASTKLSQQVG
jgi:inner membrane protein